MCMRVRARIYACVRVCLLCECVSTRACGYVCVCVPACVCACVCMLAYMRAPGVCVVASVRKKRNYMYKVNQFVTEM